MVMLALAILALARSTSWESGIVHMELGVRVGLLRNYWILKKRAKRNHYIRPIATSMVSV